MNVYTLSEMLARIGTSADAQTRAALALGLAVTVFLGPRSTTPIGSNLQPMWNALDTGNYEFYFDAMGRPVGFVNWALFDKRGDAALCAGELEAAALAAHEAGDRLWILHFFAFDQSLRVILSDLRDRFLGNYAEAKYFRFRGNRRAVKRFTHHEQSAFFRSVATGGPEHRTDLTQNRQLLGAYRSHIAELILLGECLRALHRCDPLLRSPLWSRPSVLKNWAALEQVRLYRNDAGELAGLLTWAWLSERTISQLSATPLHAAHMSEWNEGKILCLCDVAATEDVCKQLVHDVRYGLFPDEDIVLLYMAPSAGRAASIQHISRSNGAAAISQWFATASIVRAS